MINPNNKAMGGDTNGVRQNNIDITKIISRTLSFLFNKL